MTRTSIRIWTFVGALVIGAPSALYAQEGEETDLARSLARRGWFDLAEEMCDRAEKSSKSSPDDRAAVQIVRAEIMLQRAERETDSKKAREAVDKSVAMLTKFIKDNPNHKLALDARINMGYLKGRKAKIVTDELAQEQTADRTADLQKEAAAIYEDAEKGYEETIKELQATKTTDANRDAVDGAILDSRLELPRTMYEHAKLPGTDAGKKRALIEKAIKLLVDFEFDYGDRPIAFEAMQVEADCFAESGDAKNAEMKYRGVLALKQRLNEAKIPPNEYHKRILWSTTISLCQLLTKSGRAKETLALIDLTFKENKGIDAEWAGPMLKLEKADALFTLRDTQGAMALAKEVEKNEKFKGAAQAKIASWSGGGSGGAKLSPDQLMSSADNYLNREQFREGMIFLRRCIEACTTEADKTKYLAGAWFKMAQCLSAMGRRYEAAFAYEQVFTLYPKDAQAAKACFEAARCLNAEFAMSGDKRDDEAKDKFLSLLAAQWPNDPAAVNIKYLQAEKLEGAGDLKGAAAAYLLVTDKAEAYEAALVRAGYCYRTEAAKRWGEAKDQKAKDAVKSEVLNGLNLAEQPLQKFLDRTKKPEFEPKDADAVKQRQALIFVANQQLAYIYMHEVRGESQKCLEFLEKCAKELPADDERLGKIWGMQVQANLSLGNLDKAVQILDLMFEKFSDSPSMMPACKSTAIKLDEATRPLEEKKDKTDADKAVITQNLRRISKYYAKWLNDALSRAARVTLGDVTNVADSLYRIAKVLNGLDDKTLSFVDIKGPKDMPERQAFVDAAFVISLLTDAKFGKIPDAERIKLMTRLARCHGFIAKEEGDWKKAKEAYDDIVKTYKLIAANGTLDIDVLRARKELLGVYVEYGYVLFEMGRLTTPPVKFQLDNAATVFHNTLKATQPDSEPWWLAKYMVLEILYVRGEANDLKLAKIGIENIEKNSPDYDADKDNPKGRYGMKEKFLDLKAKIEKVTGGK